MRKILLSVVILWGVFAPSLQAEEVGVSASLNKRSVQVGEEIRLSIRVTGQSTNLQAPRLPPLDGFETYYTGRASHIAFVNGVSSSNVEFSYTLVPQRAGRFTLSPFEIQAGQNILRTEPLEIEVLGGQSQTPNPPAPAQRISTQPAMPQTVPQDQTSTVSSGADDNIFVQAWVDRRTLYQNEQVLLTYSLYTRYDTRYEGFDKEPETSGFWIEEFPMGRDVPRETVRQNGKRYVKADVKKLALFPTAPGNYTIQPGSLKVSIREEPQGSNSFDEFFSDSFFSGGAFFARRQNRLLTPPPIQLVVKPLPEKGKPA
ncbi:MAG: BatD family protein, partial [Candidatus Omnitrophica bacterium]|nr:BatD family protein [Candidatus Omnitrophota bacterium]